MMMTELAKSQAELLKLRSDPLVVTSNSSDSTGDTFGDTFNVCHTELEVLLKMRGKKAGDSPNFFPSWVKDMSQKHISAAAKMLIVQKLLKGPYRYPDASIPCTYKLQQTIIERKWAGKDGGCGSPTLNTAMEGLSPFSMVYLDNEELSKLNEGVEFLSKAKSTTAVDLEKQKAKLKVLLPATTDDMLLMVKRLANMLLLPNFKRCLPNHRLTKHG